MHGARAGTRVWSQLLSSPVSAAALWVARGAALVVYVAVLSLRGGPISASNDALVITLPTTAVSEGHLRLAEQETQTADPPGYALLASPLVAGLRPWLGAPRWCSDRPVPAVIAHSPQAAFYRSVLHLCADQRPGRRGALPPWWRSQALIGVGAWLVLLFGIQWLLRAVYGRPSAAELTAALALAVLPAASDALIESFHPQDLLSLGLAVMALSQALRRRWVATGALLGLAVVCHQLAVLVLLPVIAAAPDLRSRGRLVGAALTAGLAVTVPFLVADPSGTWSALTGTYSQGAGIVRSSTAVGLLGVGESLKLKIARDLPVVLDALVCLIAWWRLRQRLLAPMPLLALSLVCLSSRLVFEVSVQEYYFLGVAVLLLALELTAGRPPVWALVWVVATRYGVVELPSVTSPGWVAVAFMASALAAMAAGVVTLAAPVAMDHRQMES
ncbi:MAG TPA: hypothetical protein VKR22_12665 [Acidimicrobiales bacterium]|nr:hypothetical protein [Acidimicrobiales bacterium]